LLMTGIPLPVAHLRAGMVEGLRAIHDKVAFVFVLTRILVPACR
jgi:hypothetical protein